MLTIVQPFRELSGLFAKPAKSVLIVLNTTVDVTEYDGITVLQYGNTTEYLGYQVRTGDLVTANWALRFQNLRKRLATVTGILASVDVQIMLPNAIMLLAFLFTEAVFRNPQWTKKELHNL